MSLIIGLGHRSMQGKDVVASHLSQTFGGEYNIQLFPFARALKLEAYDALCNPDKYGEFWAQVYAPERKHLPVSSMIDAQPSEKLQWIEENKPALRRMLQVYGSEYRRNQDQFYWIKKTAQAIDEANPTIAIISDMRFINEALFVKSRKGYTVKVERVGYNNPNATGHISEEALANYLFDFTLSAEEGDLAGLKRDAEELFCMIAEMESHKSYETADFYYDPAVL